MGLFDQVVGAVAGAGSSRAEGDNLLLTSVLGLINNPQTGGIAGLVQSFQAGGLGGIVDSWVSSGQNLPITAEQIQSVLGNEQVGKIASQLGIEPDQASGKIAEFLPQIVDKLTPTGALPAGNDLLAGGLELLKGKLFG